MAAEKKELGVWVEIINLVVPTYTDNLEMIKRMCGWIVKELGPDQPLHFSRFHPQHKLTHLSPTPVEILVQARATARAATDEEAGVDAEIIDLRSLWPLDLPTIVNSVRKTGRSNWRAVATMPHASAVLPVTLR